MSKITNDDNPVCQGALWLYLYGNGGRQSVKGLSAIELLSVGISRSGEVHTYPSFFVLSHRHCLTVRERFILLDRVCALVAIQQVVVGLLLRLSSKLYHLWFYQSLDHFHCPYFDFKNSTSSLYLWHCPCLSAVCSLNTNYFTSRWTEV